MKTPTRFPIPDLRAAALAHNMPAAAGRELVTRRARPDGDPKPVIVITCNRLGPIPPEGHKLKLRRDGLHADRTDFLQRKGPMVVITSRWTWEAGMGQPTEAERKIFVFGR